MWNAQDDHYKSKGWNPQGSVYEISHGGADFTMTAEYAMYDHSYGWMNSPLHKEVIIGKGSWSSKKKFGCHVGGGFANCFFQE